MKNYKPLTRWSQILSKGAKHLSAVVRNQTLDSLSFISKHKQWGRRNRTMWPDWDPSSAGGYENIKPWTPEWKSIMEPKSSRPGWAKKSLSFWIRGGGVYRCDTALDRKSEVTTAVLPQTGSKNWNNKLQICVDPTTTAIRGLLSFSRCTMAACSPPRAETISFHLGKTSSWQSSQPQCHFPNHPPHPTISDLLSAGDKLKGKLFSEELLFRKRRSSGSRLIALKRIQISAAKKKKKLWIRAIRCEQTLPDRRTDGLMSQRCGQRDRDRQRGRADPDGRAVGERQTADRQTDSCEGRQVRIKWDRVAPATDQRSVIRRRRSSLQSISVVPGG